MNKRIGYLIVFLGIFTPPSLKSMILDNFNPYKITCEDFFGQINRYTNFMSDQLGQRPGAAPFGQAVIFPATDKVVAMSDFHGDIGAFVSNIRQLQELGYVDSSCCFYNNVRLIITGDLGDRGD